MDDSSEVVILVDENDRETGTAGKIEAHRSGALHRAFSVFVWDSDGRLLLQKRHAGKYHSGGLWTNATCGHPRPNEESAAAALRRLREEMGFACALEPIGRFRYRAAVDGGLTEHELVHLYRGLHDGDVSPDPREADGYEWAEADALAARIAAEPQTFTAWFREYAAAKWPLVPPGPRAQSQG